MWWLTVAGGLLPGFGWAQPTSSANGMVGEYYDGPDFERLVFRRRDTTLAFDWAHQSPVPGLSAEYFSVRWMGWLMPPASGRYVLHATVDDGLRIWLNDRLVLDEWRPQPVRTFTTTVDLKAGEPYKLRVDYFQDILDTRMRITWERPDAPLAPPPSSWRNLWGMTASIPQPEPIPTRFLFIGNPRPSVALSAITIAAPKPAPQKTGAVPTPSVLKPFVISRSRRPVPQRRQPVAPPLAAAKPAALALHPAPVPTLLLVDSTGPAHLSHLAIGEVVALPELYFNQGKALLLLPSRAALDRLATILHAQPELRLEVQGHTDNVGNAELNRQLSQQRAEAVSRYLTAHGVAAGQLRAVGYGGSQPVADNTDPAQRPRNRRVVLRRL